MERSLDGNFRGLGMGLIRFDVYPATLLDDWPEVHRAYLGGADGRIYPTRIEIEGRTIGCRRNSSESCHLQIAYLLPGRGRVMVSTTTLPEREAPYLLSVELARGKIVQLRNQSAQWQLAGMQLPTEFGDRLKEAQRQFAKAALSQNDAETATLLADEALNLAFMASDHLIVSYRQQAWAGRQQRFSLAPSLVGCELGPSEPPKTKQAEFLSCFNAASVSANWRDIEAIEGEYAWEFTDRQLEFCEAHRLTVRAGSLIDLGAAGLPDWLTPWEHDFFNLQSFICDFVETAIGRYAGRVRLWEVAARFNTGGVLSLNEEARLSLVARILDIARQVDGESQFLVRVDQPWGEYQARGQHRLTPLQAVDALVRSGVGLSGVNLEIAVGYLPGGTALRDPLEFSRLIDQWSLMGIPLYVTLACPSETGIDPQHASDIEPDPHVWPRPCDERQQAAWLDQIVPLLLAKPSVAGVFWSNFSDATPHRFPNAGLVTAQETPKLALARLQAWAQSRRR